MTEKEFMTFELYCVEIEGIPYYNFLSENEWSMVFDRYEKYMAGYKE